MRGRHVFMQSLAAHGVARIFGNPGTTESPLIHSLPDYPGIEYVIALHEGIAVGAASYYYQASGELPVVNLHVAPGLGNAIGMMYGALKANSAMLVTAGQQDTRMRLREPLLSHDLVAMAAPVSKWSVQAESADELALIMHRAFKFASDPPAGPVFIALPIDVMEQETAVRALPAGPLYRAAMPDPAGIEALAALILQSVNPAIVAGDDVARTGAVGALVRVADAIGAPVWVEGLRQQLSFPTGHGNARPALPFEAGAIRNALGGADLVLLLGGPFFEEVWYSTESPFPEGALAVQVEEAPRRLAFNHALAAGVVGALPAALNQLLHAIEAGADAEFRRAAAARNADLEALKRRERAEQQGRLERAWDRVPMSMARALGEIRKGTPANAVVVDEAITAGPDLARSFEFRAPGDYYGARGGGIGQGLAGALGVKLAHGDRPVLAISGDGSAMYSIQALWTAAHHDLAIVFVILANREYRVLKHNMDAYRQRFRAESNQGYTHMDLAPPALDFVELARGMGVEGVRVEDSDALAPTIEAAFAAGKAYLVEVVIEGKR